MKLYPYAALIIAILFEIVGTLFLQASQQFSKPVPTVAMAVSYMASIYFLSLSLKTIPVGVAYATWNGVGIAIIALSSFFIFKQKFDTPALIGIALISTGVVLISGFSQTATT
jgi:small multidrug resistance pump